MTHSCTVRAQCARKTDRLEQDDSAKPFACRKNLVDVAGIEPATPCLQSKQKINLSRCFGCVYGF